MKISEILTEEFITPHLKGSSKAEVIDAINIKTPLL